MVVGLGTGGESDTLNHLLHIELALRQHFCTKIKKQDYYNARLQSKITIQDCKARLLQCKVTKRSPHPPLSSLASREA